MPWAPVPPLLIAPAMPNVFRSDINHHLFSAVVIALIRLFQFGGPVEIRPSIPWHWLASQSAVCFSYLISQVALWLTI